MPVSSLQQAVRCQHTIPKHSVCLCFGICRKLHKTNQSESFNNEFLQNHNSLLPQWAKDLWSCQGCKPQAVVRHVTAWLPRPLQSPIINPSNFIFPSSKPACVAHLSDFQCPHSMCYRSCQRSLIPPRPPSTFTLLLLQVRKSTHLMGLCVSRKWMARVSHWPCRWATRCCPH